MKKILLSLLFSISILTAQAQDPVYSMFWMNDINLNPAFVGNNEGLNINCLNRLEWTKVISHFNTYSFSGSISTPSLHGGLGLTASYDDEGEGTIGTSQYGFVYSYAAVNEQSKSKISFALQPEYCERKVNDYNNLIYSNQIDPILGTVFPQSLNLINQKVSYVNFHAGFVYDQITGNKDQNELVVGFAFHNITKPNISLFNDDATLPPRFTFNGSFIVRPKNFAGEITYGVNPYLIYENSFFENNGAFNTILIGTNFFIASFETGIGYRKSQPIFNLQKSDAIIFNLNILFDRNETSILLGLSYDATLSKLAANSGGSYEIGIRIMNNKKYWLKGRSRSATNQGNRCRDLDNRRAKMRGKYSNFNSK